MSGLLSASTSAGVATAGTVGAAAAVTLPFVVAGTVVANIRSKHKVEAEFARRRLELPMTLAPGQTTQGSLFFPITPAPQRLVLLCHADDQTRPLDLDLAPLAGLHVGSPPKPAEPREGKAPRPGIDPRR